MHEPPPRPLREMAHTAIRVLESGGRFLRWLGLALVVIAPVIWWLNSDRGGEVLNALALTALGWAAILVGWHMVLAFMRWWIWWHEEAGE